MFHNIYISVSLYIHSHHFGVHIYLPASRPIPGSQISNEVADLQLPKFWEHEISSRTILGSQISKAGADPTATEVLGT